MFSSLIGLAQSASLGMLTPLVLVCFVGGADPSGERIKEPLVNGSRKTRQKQVKNVGIQVQEYEELVQMLTIRNRL